MLTDVFKHLLLNAVEYKREGVPPRIHISSTQTNGEVCFAVKDNGMRIKREHHARIFDEYPGIGAGLSLCKRLIENQGGKVWLESEPGAGSTFYFTLAAAIHKTTAASG